MNLVRTAGAALQRGALWGALATIVLCLVLASLAFLAAALFIWLAHHVGAAGAAAITALALLILALQIVLFGGLWLSKLRTNSPGLFDDAASTIAMLTTIATLLVRRDPKRTLLLALLGGALAEYLAARD